MHKETVTQDKHCKFCDKAFSTLSDHWKVVRKVYLECKLQAKKTRQDAKAAKNIEKYGTARPKEDKAYHMLVNKKRTETMKERYGGNAMQVPELKEKQRISLLESHGVTSPSKSQSVKNKIKATNL